MEGSLLADRYRLVRLLGSGATGSVWLARDETGNRDVAVKLLAPHVAGTENTRARFLREARLASGVANDHVPAVHDHGITDDGHPYLVMEFVPGPTLRERLSEEGRLSIHETAAIVGDVCRGLAAAHEAGLVHRDLKPENVLLATEADGTGEMAKILDFGSAKATDILAEPGVDPTRSGDLVGTPSYVSPEQALGLKTVGPAADLWAVGVMAFECVTGARPFEARALGPLIGKILSGAIPVPSKVAPEAGIPPAFDEWMARALSREPDGRFATAGELAGALARVAQAHSAASREDEGPVSVAWQTGDIAYTARAAIKHLGPEILRYLGSVLANEAAVEDAYSLFCERLWASLPGFEGRCSFRSWAYLIARRASVDVVRAEGRHLRRQAPLSDSHFAEVAEQVRTATLPLLKTAGRSALAQLRDALPHEDKMLLVLRVDRGLPWEDMARVFLSKESPTDAELRRESARLRKRFQLVKERLRERAKAAGIVDDDSA
jgi:serine/threonine-protein kinase